MKIIHKNIKTHKNLLKKLIKNQKISKKRIQNPKTIYRNDFLKHTAKKQGQRHINFANLSFYRIYIYRIFFDFGHL
jgi:hypothetical protein